MGRGCGKENASTHSSLPKVDIRQVLEVCQPVSPSPSQQHAVEAAPRQIELAHLGARFLDCLGTEIGFRPVQNVNLKVLERLDDCFVGVRAVVMVLDTDINDVLHALVLAQPRQRRRVSRLCALCREQKDRLLMFAGRREWRHQRGRWVVRD